MFFLYKKKQPKGFKVNYKAKAGLSDIWSEAATRSVL